MNVWVSLLERCAAGCLYLWVKSANIGVNLSECLTKKLGVHNGWSQDGLTVAFLGPLAGPIHLYQSITYGLGFSQGPKLF